MYAAPSLYEHAIERAALYADKRTIVNNVFCLIMTPRLDSYVVYCFRARDTLQRAQRRKESDRAARSEPGTPKTPVPDALDDDDDEVRLLALLLYTSLCLSTCVNWRVCTLASASVHASRTLTRRACCAERCGYVAGPCRR